MNKSNESVYVSVENNSRDLIAKHDSELADPLRASLARATGIDNVDVSRKLLAQCVCVSGCLSAADSTDKEKETALKNICHTLEAISPQDPVETLLVTRSLALHDQGMRYLEIASGDVGREGKNIYVNLAVKMLRLSNETICALMTWRRKEQKISVVHQHVDVRGVNAIVGISGDGIGGKMGSQPHVQTV